MSIDCNEGSPVSARHAQGARRRRPAITAAIALAAAATAALLAFVPWPAASSTTAAAGSAAAPSTDPQVARGAYLARIGNCAGCHTARGGMPYAGGLGIETPFGTVYAGNLTPDPEHGLGRWTADDFRRALHEGRSRDGRLLYPVFPYENYTRITPEDSDALYAYLRTLAPSTQPNRPHALRFPYDRQAALAVWRALFFRPGVYTPDPARSAEWNRGAYLVRGLGHCAACHAGRNMLGAIDEDIGLAGGMIPGLNWYAPPLGGIAQEAAPQQRTDAIAALLGTGSSTLGAAMGPMGEVVFLGTQHLEPADLRAMAGFLATLPAQGRKASAAPAAAQPAVLERGGGIYREHCERCHGPEGQGAEGAYPALAGNRKVQMPVPVNVVRLVLDGGYPPATAGNPRPYGMPPFRQALSDAQVADVVSYVRSAWGNRAGAVSELDVMQVRR